MEIKYLGHSSFLIKSKETKLVTDPYDTSMVGIKFPKVEAQIVTISHYHSDHDRKEMVIGNPLIIDMPGEFEKMGIRIFGYPSYHDKKKGEERGENTLYKIETERISVLHSGDLGLVPDDDFIDAIGKVDILFVPVGGFYTIDASEAVELIHKIEPSIVIPMHYNHSRLNQEVFKQIAPVEEFLKKMEAENIIPIPKLVIKKEELTEEMKVIVLELQN